MDNRRALGMAGEKMALCHLQSMGWQLLARNFRCRLGEIDLVFKDGRQIVFVEVRTKSSERYGSGFESITAQKRLRLRKLAQCFLAQQSFNGYKDAEVRFDVIAIFSPPTGPLALEHLIGAF